MHQILQKNREQTGVLQEDSRVPADHQESPGSSRVLLDNKTLYK